MRILIVEDSSTDRKLLRYLLESRFQQEAKFRETDTLEGALKYLRQGNIDCVLLDLSLPDSAGRETFQKIHTQFPSVPKVIMTSTKNRQLALELIRDGASDYIVKNYADEETLFSRIMFSIEKERRSIRVPPVDADYVRRLETASASMKSAHESGQVGAANQYAMETTAAIADISHRMFAEIQKVSIEMSTQGARQERLLSQVQVIDNALFHGENDKPSLVSQVQVLDHKVRSVVSDIRELRLEQDENRQSVVGLEIDRARNQTRREMRSLWDSNKTKIIVAVITTVTAFLGTITTIWLAGSSQESNQSNKK